MVGLRGQLDRGGARAARPPSLWCVFVAFLLKIEWNLNKIHHELDSSSSMTISFVNSESLKFVWNYIHVYLIIVFLYEFQ